MFEFRSEAGGVAIALDDEGFKLPNKLGPWIKIGPASNVTYAETIIIERDGFCLRDSHQ